MHDRLKRQIEQHLRGEDLSEEVQALLKAIDRDYHAFDELEALSGKNDAVRADLDELKSTGSQLENSVSLLNATLESTTDGIVFANNDGEFESFNTKFRDIWKFTDELLDLQNLPSMIKHMASQLKNPLGFAAGLRDLITDTVKEGYDIFELKDGSIIEYVSLPQKLGRVWSFRNITDRMQTVSALKESEERYALALLGSKDGIWDWNVLKNELYFSARARAIIGLEPVEKTGQLNNWIDLIHPEDQKLVTNELESHMRGETEIFRIEYRIKHSRGEYRWMLTRGVAVRNEEGVVTRVAGSTTDITGRKAFEQLLEYEALHDSLTSLPNRTLLTDRLDRCIRRRRRRKEYLFAVLFLDLNRFKIVNDSLGHATGDQLLKEVSLRLKRAIRPGDTVARLGGDEFAILADDLNDVSDVNELAERLHAALSEPFQLLGHNIVTSTSIGIALSSNEYAKPDEMLRDADSAMYRAKESGSQSFAIFDQEMHKKMMKLLELEEMIRSAYENDLFKLYFQPIISASSGELTGCEALLRLQQAEGSAISIDEIIAVSEDSGQILQLGEWALREACQFAASLAEAGRSDMRVSVNVSSRQFQQGGLEAQLRKFTNEAGISPAMIELELTETILLGNQLDTTNALRRLKDTGVAVSIDDFGTGYSSFSYLKQFPLDALKIDLSFISGIPSNSDDCAITTTIINLAHSLDLKVIAEGVEREEQLRFLHDQNCDQVQGFLYSAAIPANQFLKLLSEFDSSLIRSSG